MTETAAEYFQRTKDHQRRVLAKLGHAAPSTAKPIRVEPPVRRTAEPESSAS